MKSSMPKAYEESPERQEYGVPEEAESGNVGCSQTPQRLSCKEGAREDEEEKCGEGEEEEEDEAEVPWEHKVSAENKRSGSS